MEDLSLHILDIGENSIAAGARTLSITISEDAGRDLLCIEIADDGKGMSAEVAEKAADPFTTSRTTRRVGLGLALLREAALAANGDCAIHSEPGTGTKVTVTFQMSHIDRKPLGCMADTIAALLAASARVNIRYRHVRDGRTVMLDTEEIRQRLGEDSLDSVEALGYIRAFVNREEATLAH